MKTSSQLAKLFHDTSNEVAAEFEMIGQGEAISWEELPDDLKDILIETSQRVLNWLNQNETLDALEAKYGGNQLPPLKGMGQWI